MSKPKAALFGLLILLFFVVSMSCNFVLDVYWHKIMNRVGEAVPGCGG